MNKKSSARWWIWSGRVGIFLFLVFVFVLMVGTMLSPDFWFTADQRGDWYFRHGKFEQAAKIFSDSLRQGVALYRAGDFLPASKAFVRVRDAAGAFDQGNALLMHGAYDQAIAAFDQALGWHPGWKEAEENRALAVTRRDSLKIQGGNMTERMEEGNETVINLNAKHGQSSPESAGGDELSDAELQATWLRRVQTAPGDFLRVKFSYQAQAQAQKGKSANP
jgi:Ca-activated chloride channel family protein